MGMQEKWELVVLMCGARDGTQSIIPCPGFVVLVSSSYSAKTIISCLEKNILSALFLLEDVKLTFHYSLHDLVGNKVNSDFPEQWKLLCCYLHVETKQTDTTWSCVSVSGLQQYARLTS